MKLKHYTRYGFTIAAETLAKAKAIVDDQITATMTADYTPEIIECRGWAILVYRTQYGYCSRMIREPNQQISVSGAVSCWSDTETRKQVIRECRQHIAQLAWKPNDGIDSPLELDESQKRDFATWASWQLRFNHAKAVLGLDFDKARRYADCDPTLLADMRSELFSDLPADMVAGVQ